MDNFVILKTFFSSLDAHNAKNLLESSGVFSELVGELNAVNYNVFTPSNGGIRLFVHKDEFESASKILDQT
jgi:hypothetical protein